MERKKRTPRGPFTSSQHSVVTVVLLLEFLLFLGSRRALQFGCKKHEVVSECAFPAVCELAAADCTTSSDSEWEGCLGTPDTGLALPAFLCYMVLILERCVLHRLKTKQNKTLAKRRRIIVSFFCRTAQTKIGIKSYTPNCSIPV